MKINGFSLAEILITIGIIGIVAAMTLPGLITNYKVRVLKAQFEKADYTITQALKKAGLEAGYDIGEFYIPGSATGKYESESSEYKRQVELINPYWLDAFNSKTQLKVGDLAWKNVTLYSMFGEKTHPVSSWSNYNGGYILNNGLFIFPLSASGVLSINHPKTISFFFDTNGPYKGPNRWGHDVFIYTNFDAYPQSCNPLYKSSEAGKYCYWYAHKNVSPIDSSKPYWDILYKPKSWWEKQSNK